MKRRKQPPIGRETPVLTLRPLVRAVRLALIQRSGGAPHVLIRR